MAKKQLWCSSKNTDSKPAWAYISKCPRGRDASHRGWKMKRSIKGDSAHTRGCISFKQIIYSAGSLRGVIWRTQGGVGLALGVEWIPKWSKGASSQPLSQSSSGRVASIEERHRRLRGQNLSENIQQARWWCILFSKWIECDIHRLKTSLSPLSIMGATIYYYFYYWLIQFNFLD